MTGAVDRKHRLRRRELLDTARRVSAAEGIEALSMSRIAREHDTVVSALYRYFPNKAALVAELQKESFDHLEASLAGAIGHGEEAFGAWEPSVEELEACRLVLIGRWFVAASAELFAELRLLQTLLFIPTQTLGDFGVEVLPHALTLVAHPVDAVTRAQEAGVISDADPFDRAVGWTAALNGALIADSLEHYLPDIFGGGRVARLVNLDILSGWGLGRAALERATRAVDELDLIQPAAG